MKLYLGDCLEIMPTLPAQSVDAIITDLPYGTTACKWDAVIPFAPMWEQVKRILKPRGVFVTTASQPFTSALVMSNPDWYRHEWQWDKVIPSNFGCVKYSPLRVHETILIFSGGAHKYNPQMGTASKRFGKKSTPVSLVTSNGTGEDGIGYPKSIIQFMRPNNLTGGGLHPTQKPVALYEYLIRTYTNPGETVADITAGSGTTGVACVKTGRDFIGIEKLPEYFAIMEQRIKEAQAQPVLEGVYHS